MVQLDGSYCNSLFRYSRYVSREVRIGNIPLGGNNPIRVQSMTTTDTMDTEATIEQSIRMIKAGCEYVRITAPSIKEAHNLQNIKDGLRSRGYDTPIVADIHFTPNAAEVAARIVEKVRVNPGNYADRKKFETHIYDDATYYAEKDRIRERFTPLVKICKEHGTAMRIGTNHGSLSDRILSRYGDTPLGMVESALEFVRICEENAFDQIVLSMKASNPQVMVQAYRLLVQKMTDEGMDYPLHLGVTEAGEGEDGRIKSAVGIGTLLEDGLGDTVRVSLTEEPEFELPVALSLINRYKSRSGHNVIETVDTDTFNAFEFNKRVASSVKNIGEKNVPRVIADYSSFKNISATDLASTGNKYSKGLDKWHLTDNACDYIYLGNGSINFGLPGTLSVIQDQNVWQGTHQHFPLFTIEEYSNTSNKSNELNFISCEVDELKDAFIEGLKQDGTAVLILESSNSHAFADLRSGFLKLQNKICNTPIIIKRTFDTNDLSDFQIYASTDIGGLLLEGFGDGTMLIGEISLGIDTINSTCFGILQATRSRITRTDYISCPSCGRTLFDLQETTAKIRERTDHLKGVKIGIMGCIVNGPGEMADADYGYVGTGVDKITLYKGQEVVQKNIPSSEAVDALIGLIKSHGDWVERELV
ncbi:MAG: (E)-4-hydroxy-3-methylbut-2-enyl-diphosphate synthase [Flavobacteriales bacterium]|nr:(E)-4-hydroxy-3-methylbut-2-enyl-diphosphate synthase [Flavobacteriales bacterium]